MLSSIDSHANLMAEGPLQSPSSWVGSIVGGKVKVGMQEEEEAAAASYNAATKESTDVRRAASRARSKTPPRLQGAVRKVQAINRLVRKNHDAPQFTELWDDETSRAYYVNKKTGASSWRRPVTAGQRRFTSAP